MLFLLFQVGKDRFALDSKLVAEVAPLVHLKCIPHAPASVAGLFNYRGSAVPVIDLCQVFFGSMSPMRLSTRIMLVNYRATSGETFLLGLMAEQITETVRMDPSAFVPSGVDVQEAA